MISLWHGFTFIVMKLSQILPGPEHSEEYLVCLDKCDKKKTIFRVAEGQRDIFKSKRKEEQFTLLNIDVKTSLSKQKQTD